MDRLLVAEMPGLGLQADNSGGYTIITPGYGDWEPYPGFTDYWIHKSVINLEGYQMNDMTAYFRQSFEQRGSTQSVGFVASPQQPLSAEDADTVEIVMITNVPLSDAGIGYLGLALPGFLPPSTAGFFDLDNIDRESVIHGRQYVAGIGNNVARLVNSGGSYTQTVQDNDFSSLEPSATDKLYCYRIIQLPDSGILNGQTVTSAGLRTVVFPPCRVILDTQFAKEDDIPYLMRLKRGYELANQV